MPRLSTRATCTTSICTSTCTSTCSASVSIADFAKVWVPDAIERDEAHRSLIRRPHLEYHARACTCICTCTRRCRCRHRSQENTASCPEGQGSHVRWVGQQHLRRADTIPVRYVCCPGLKDHSHCVYARNKERSLVLLVLKVCYIWGMHVLHS